MSPQRSSAGMLCQGKSFLGTWSAEKLPDYWTDYGGERAGVPKGDVIPFPRHKVEAAVALLSYGAPAHQTLASIAKTAGVTSALLRVWRAEDRFLAVYRRAVWECADAFVHLLGESWQAAWLSPSEEFLQHFGIPLQQAILRRLCVDVLHMTDEWIPFSLSPKWLSECTLVGAPPMPFPHCTDFEVRLMRLNSFALLSINLPRLAPKEPGLAQWASNKLFQNWAMKAIIDNDLRSAIQRGDRKTALGLLDFLKGDSPVEDMQQVSRLLAGSQVGVTIAGRRK